MTHPETTRKRKNDNLFSFIFQIIVFTLRHRRSQKNKELCWRENKMQTGETLGLIFRRRNVFRQSLFPPHSNLVDVHGMHAISTVLILSAPTLREVCYEFIQDILEFIFKDFSERCWYCWKLRGNLHFYALIC